MYPEAPLQARANPFIHSLAVANISNISNRFLPTQPGNIVEIPGGGPAAKTHAPNCRFKVVTLWAGVDGNVDPRWVSRGIASSKLRMLWGVSGAGIVVFPYASCAQRFSRRGISSPALARLPSTSRFQAKYSPSRSSA